MRRRNEVREVGGRLRLVVTERLLVIPDPAKRVFDFRLEAIAFPPLPLHTCIRSDALGLEPCRECGEDVEGEG